MIFTVRFRQGAISNVIFLGNVSVFLFLLQPRHFYLQGLMTDEITDFRGILQKAKINFMSFGNR